MSCIFCGIIEDKSSATIVFENDTIIAFNDIKPASKYHYLIVPKKHYNDVTCFDNSHRELRNSCKVSKSHFFNYL